MGRLLLKQLGERLKQSQIPGIRRLKQQIQEIEQLLGDEHRAGAGLVRHLESDLKSFQTQLEDWDKWTSKHQW